VTVDLIVDFFLFFLCGRQWGPTFVCCEERFKKSMGILKKAFCRSHNLEKFALHNWGLWRKNKENNMGGFSLNMGWEEKCVKKD
jgi:hypothetical protein